MKSLNGIKLLLWIVLGLASALVFSLYLLPSGLPAEAIDAAPRSSQAGLFAIVACLLSLVLLALLSRVGQSNAAEDRHKMPEFDRASEVWTGPPRVAARTKNLLAFVISFAVGFGFIPREGLLLAGGPDSAVQKARGGDALIINGDRDAFSVTFTHALHVEINGDRDSCVLCHHMNVPGDEQSGCYECHSDMVQPTDAFGHDWHSSAMGAALSCRQCHTTGVEKTADSAAKCTACHKDLHPEGAEIEVTQYAAASYKAAMHGLCVKCHKEYDPDLAACKTCHGDSLPEN